MFTFRLSSTCWVFSWINSHCLQHTPVRHSMWPFISLSNHIMMNTKYHDAKVLDAMQSWDFWQMKPRNEKVCQGGKYEICKLSKIIFFLLSCKQENVWYQWELRCDGFHSQTFFRRQISFSSACEKNTTCVRHLLFHLAIRSSCKRSRNKESIYQTPFYTSRAPIFYTELFFHSGGSLHSSLP